jgi:hypothetical protein
MPNDNCFQSREVTGVCDVCEAPADMMHLPTRPRGIYCEKHCPACSMSSIMALVAIHDDRSSHAPDRAVTVRERLPEAH